MLINNICQVYGQSIIALMYKLILSGISGVYCRIGNDCCCNIFYFAVNFLQ